MVARLLTLVSLLSLCFADFNGQPMPMPMPMPGADGAEVGYLGADSSIVSDIGVCQETYLTCAVPPKERLTSIASKQQSKAMTQINTITKAVEPVPASVAATAQTTTPAAAAPPVAAPAAQGVISSAQAASAIEAAVAKAKELKIPSNIAVTDPYGHLVAFTRMDGAVLASIDIAIKKAKTVAMFGGRYRTGDLFNGEFCAKSSKCSPRKPEADY
jgi:hypothetical protein